MIDGLARFVRLAQPALEDHADLGRADQQEEDDKSEPETMRHWRRNEASGSKPQGVRPSYPLLRSPAETPLIVSWMPVRTFSLDARARCSFRSSTCTWFKGSR